MATIRVLCGLICFAGLFGHWQFDRHLLTRHTAADKLIAIAQSQMAVRETSPQGQQAIRQYLQDVQLKSEAPWCAAFVSWVYHQAGYGAPRTAWSPALFPRSRQIQQPEKGAVFGIYSKNLGRIAHCGLVEKVQHDWIISIEGNTNRSGSREGDGVYRKWRHRRAISAFARWLPEHEK